MIVKLLTEHQMAFLSLKRGCTGSSESTLVLSKCQIVGNLMPRLNYKNSWISQSYLALFNILSKSPIVS